MFRDSQIVIITNFVVVSSVGIKRAVCRSSTVYGNLVCRKFALNLENNLQINFFRAKRQVKTTF